MVTCDVLVIGGGPAGAAAAASLARRGLSVGLVERTDYESARVGETVPPSVVKALARLGALHAFREEGHHAAPGLLAAWGEVRPIEQDFIFNPYGHGWHLDRTRFDRGLAAAAATAGAIVYRGAHAQSIERLSDASWRIVVRQQRADRATMTLAAPWTIDATGRTATIARRLGIGDAPTIALSRSSASGHSRGTNPATVVESCADGWWYAAPLPDGDAVAAFFTDIDLLPSGSAARARLWTARFGDTRLVRDDFVPRAVPVRTVAAQTTRLDRVAIPGYLAVGDAAQSHDPLSGRGIIKALESGLFAADTIAAARDGDRDELDRFTQTADLEFARYMTYRRAHYRDEVRWAHSDFWRRRHAPVSA